MFNYKTPSSVQNCHEVFLKYHIIHKVGFFSLKVVGAKSLEDMVQKLKKPRKIMLMVKAGQAVDDFIQKLIPLLSKGDIIIDGGNSEHQDTTRRCKELEKKGILYVGSGVSGGEEGARYGPSLMPGGHASAWPHIKEIFQVLLKGKV